jgi:hypothetical protein
VAEVLGFPLITAEPELYASSDQEIEYRLSFSSCNHKTILEFVSIHDQGSINSKQSRPVPQVAIKCKKFRFLIDKQRFR